MKADTSGRLHEEDLRMKIHRTAREFLMAGTVALLSTQAGAEPRAGVTTELRLREPLDRRTVLRAVLERNPAVAAAEQRARGIRSSARAEGGLPSPELMGQVWQVPLSRPTALDSQMIMVGVSQTFPAPGMLAAREQSVMAEANQQDAIAADRARTILREAGHAFSDYQESTGRHRVHRAHLVITRHLFDLAQARHGAGGPLIDVTRAQVELSRMEADVVTDATLIESASAHLNALLVRGIGAPLGAPIETEPVVPSGDASSLVAKAHLARPEMKQAQAEREAKEYAVEAAEREATWPSFSLGALYFPPTTAMPQHGYGATLSVSLPWLWGAAGSRKDAERELARAARTNAEAARIPIEAEVVIAETKARTAAHRLLVLRDRALPASRRSFDVAEAGFESGRTDLMTVLDTRRSVVDVERDIVMARSDLEHALTDLETAVGSEIAVRPLQALDPKELERGTDDH
jgi:cobalt-zinc-cadmium efflux system outer membrane protein